MSTREVIAAIAAVALAAIVVWRWKKLSGERKALGIVVALALAVYASGLLSELPDPKKIIGDIAQTLGPWTYAVVGVMAFLETGAFVGLIAPGETVVIAGGVIAGQGEISLLPLICLIWSEDCLQCRAGREGASDPLARSSSGHCIAAVFPDARTLGRFNGSHILPPEGGSHEIIGGCVASGSSWKIDRDRDARRQPSDVDPTCRARTVWQRQG